MSHYSSEDMNPAARVTTSYDMSRVVKSISRAHRVEKLAIAQVMNHIDRLHLLLLLLLLLLMMMMLHGSVI